MPTKALDRLMFAQGGLCFFCNSMLPKAEASVEHLVASANGGGNGEDNCVACCKALNALLGKMSIKEKIRVVLNQKGSFKCPNGAGKSAAPVAIAPVAKAKLDDYSIALNDLVKRGAAKPQRVETLKGTIRATLKGITEDKLDKLIGDLQANGKITVAGTTVSYSL